MFFIFMDFLKKQKYRILSIFIILTISYLGYFYIVQPEINARIEDKNETTLENKKDNVISLGLDLVGGSQLVYSADISNIEKQAIDGSMNSLKTVLEKRLNPFGVAEVSITIERPSVFTESAEKSRRVIIQIPGVADPEDAKAMIGKIPTLEFKIQKGLDEFEDTGLTGRYLKTSNFSYHGTTSQPIVTLDFTDEGGKIFGELTSNNVGELMAIFLDGQIISAPRINAPIIANSAIIEGNFTKEEAKELSNNLKFGALPVPISIISSNTVSPSLGQEVLSLGVKSALLGLLFVCVFLIYFYRFAGFVASLALFSYSVLILSIFKLFGFVFTSAGIAGFIISIGMAVDANVLVFERIREELRDRKTKEAIKVGFKRAWLSIRDGNLSSIITAVILFYTTTALVRGFSLTFGFGVIVSMFSAIVITRIFLYSLIGEDNSFKMKERLFGKFKK